MSQFFQHPTNIIICVLFAAVILVHLLRPAADAHLVFPEDESEDEPSSDEQITNAPVVLVEVDTGGLPQPPEKVMVHVYRWTPAGYDYQGHKPLSDYAIEMPRLSSRPAPRLPSAGDIS